MDYVLGMDIGTGSVKAVAVGVSGKAFEVCQQYYSFNAPKPGYYEQDPEQIWNGFKLCLQELVNKTGALPIGIGLSCAMHSLIAVDKNCRALSPMTTWADNRSAEIAKKLKASAAGINIYRTTGTPLHAMSPLCKLIWLRQHDAVLFDKTHKFISIKEYIWYKLFREFKADHSVASGTGLFDISRLIWHPESLALSGITSELLSDPVPTDYMKVYHIAHGDPELDFLSGIPFIIGASDGCLANLGSMANRPGAAAMTIGTSGAVRIASNRPLPDEKAMPFSYILDKDTFICGGAINNGGIALQWWLRNIAVSGISDDGDYLRIFKQIEHVQAGSKGLLFIPYLTGERAPVWDSESCGSFFGVKLEHEQAHFSRAVVEGICFAMKDVLDVVQRHAEPVSHISISGGLIRSSLWMQILADITGKRLVIAQTEDASATGAAFMAMKKLALIEAYPTYDLQEVRVIEPDTMNAAVYADSFKVYTQLYAVLKETMHQLYQLNS